MDIKKFRQWEPPTIKGSRAHFGLVLKASTEQHKEYFDMLHTAFKEHWPHSKIDMHVQHIFGGKKSKKEPKSPEAKEKTKPLPKHIHVTPRTKVESGEKKAPGGIITEKELKTRTGKAAPKKTPKPASPPKQSSKKESGPRKIRQSEKDKPKVVREVEVSAPETKEPKLLPSKTVTASEKPSAKADSPKKSPVRKISEPKEKVSAPKSTKPLGIGSGVMTSSTGGPQITGHKMPVVVGGRPQVSKGFSDLDELEAMSKARFKPGTGQVGVRKKGSAKVKQAAKPPPRAVKPIPQMKRTMPTAPAAKTGTGQGMGTSSSTPGGFEMTGAPTTGIGRSTPKVEHVRSGTETPSAMAGRMGLQVQGRGTPSAGPKPIGSEEPAGAPKTTAGVRPVGAETPAAAGATKTPGASPTSKMTGGPQLSGMGSGTKPSAAQAPEAAKPSAPEAAKPETPSSSKPKSGQMTTTGGSQLTGRDTPIGSAAGIGYAEGSFIGAETGGAKTGGTAATHVAGTEAAGLLSGGGSAGGAKPSRQMFTPEGYAPSRSVFTGRGGPGGGTAAQSGPGQKPTQSAMKSFMGIPMGIPGTRRLPPK